MTRLKQKTVKYIFTMLMISIFICFSSVSVFAYTYDNLSPGTYKVVATLSCYVNAMDGVEFGAPLLTSAEIHVESDGDKTMTLHFAKSSVTIYNITCDTFIDASPSYVTEDKGVKSGTIGVYDKVGNLITEGVSYTLSNNTAENAQKEQVNYVDSITFPLSHKSDTYNLTFYINSNVMGVQFCNSSGGSSYPAILTVDWSSLPTKSQRAESDNSESDGNDQEEGSNENNSVNVEKDQSSSSEVEKNESTAVEVENDENTSANVESDVNTSADVETMDGLNIYHAEEEVDSEEVASEEVSGKGEKYLAYYNMPVILIAGSVAVVLIVIGIVLVIMSKRSKTKGVKQKEGKQ